MLQQTSGAFAVTQLHFAVIAYRSIAILQPEMLPHARGLAFTGHFFFSGTNQRKITYLVL